MGRFLAEDVLRFNTGANFYSYVRNQPISFADPLGMFPTWRHRQHTFDTALKVFGPQCANKAKEVSEADAQVDTLPTISSMIKFALGQGDGWQYGGPHFPVNENSFEVPLKMQ